MPDKSGWSSFWTGVWEGDLDTEDDSWWKVIGQTLTGLVPYVGQVADARDTLAAIDGVWEGKDGSWANLGMAGIAWVPLVGDLAKGGLKVGRKGLKAGVKVADEVVEVAKHAPAPHVPDFTGKLKGLDVVLPGVKTRPLSYTKRTKAASEAMRKEFNNKVRSKFAKDLVNDPEKLAKLKEAGLGAADIKKLQNGEMPTGYWVHHKVPLDDGGTNNFDNLVLIKNDPYHKAITIEHNALIKGMKEGETKVFDFPIPDGFIYPPKPL